MPSPPPPHEVVTGVDFELSARNFTTFFKAHFHKAARRGSLAGTRLMRIQAYRPDLRRFPQLCEFMPSVHLDKASTDFVVHYPDEHAVAIPSEHLWQDNPYHIPHRLQLAPVFISCGSVVWMRLFTDHHLRVSFTAPALGQLYDTMMAENSVYTGWSGCPQRADHSHRLMFLASKLRYLVSHHRRKVFGVQSYDELAWLGYVRSCLNDPVLWLKITGNLPGRVKDIAQLSKGFLRHDLPKCEVIPVEELRRAWRDPAMIYPMFVEP